ncbi:lysylphosphatidylglycerol synthase domain-containing protein [Angustibacter aerolatus]
MSRARVVALVRLVFVVLVVALLAAAVLRDRHAVADALRTASAAGVVGALLLAAVSIAASALGWRRLLAGLGSPLPVLVAGEAFCVGQLGKYLPGSVWTVVAQADVAARRGVPRTRTAAAGLVGIGMTLLVGVVVGAPALPLLARARGDGLVVLSVLAVVAGLVVLLPPVLHRVLALGMRLLRRPPLEHRLGGRDVAVSAGWLAVAWVTLGLSAAAVAVDVGLPSHEVPRLVSAFVLAAAAGQLVVLAPAGLGVRDVLLAVALEPALGHAGAVGVAVLSRVLITVADVAMALLGWLAARREPPVGSAA